MKFSFFLTSAVSFLILLDSTPADAQKRQKDIQDNSLFVSAPIKVDARLNEWQDTLQAFNRTALVGYTIANDKKNLYLVIKSSDAINNAKILAGGISLAVNTEGKKKDKEGFTITFPVIKAGSRSAAVGQSGSTRGGQFQRRSSETDPAILERRKAQIAQFKEIKVSGFKAINDSLISIYNEYGIKVAVDYDAKSNLVYELAVPLNLLDLAPDSKKEIAYNIKINGRSFGWTRGMSAGNQERGGSDGRENRRGGTGYVGGSQPMGNSMFTSFGQPVDFWGKYSLATQ